MTNKGCMLLEKLPLELRQICYAEALTFPGEILISPSQDDFRFEHHGRPFQLPGLLKTCRQIQMESSKVFYACNSFRVISLDTSPETLRSPVRWLRSLSPSERKESKQITVHFKYSGFERSLQSWSNILDGMVASGQDPMKAFAHLPGHLYLQRCDMLKEILLQLKGLEHLDFSAIVFEIEEFDGDMFPHIWRQCWLDCLEEIGGAYKLPVIRKVSYKEVRPLGS